VRRARCCLWCYNIVSPQHGLEHLSGLFTKSGVEEQSHLVPPEETDRIRLGYEEDGSLRSKSVLTTSDPVKFETYLGCNASHRISLEAEPMKDRCGYKGNSSTYQGKTLFLIDIAIGTFPFSLAKFIDVAWDVVVGRGSQVFSWVDLLSCLYRQLDVDGGEHSCILRPVHPYLLVDKLCS